jgi:hypothetical protein
MASLCTALKVRVVVRTLNADLRHQQLARIAPDVAEAEAVAPIEWRQHKGAIEQLSLMHRFTRMLKWRR